MLSIDDDIPWSCFGNASYSRSNAHLGTRIMRQAYTELGEHPLHETRAIPAGRSIASRHIRIALELQSIVGQCLTSGTRRSRRNAADVGTFGRAAGSLSLSLRLACAEPSAPEPFGPFLPETRSGEHPNFRCHPNRRWTQHPWMCARRENHAWPRWSSGKNV